MTFSNVSHAEGKGSSSISALIVFGVSNFWKFASLMVGKLDAVACVTYNRTPWRLCGSIAGECLRCLQRRFHRCIDLVLTRKDGWGRQNVVYYRVVVREEGLCTLNRWK